MTCVAVNLIIVISCLAISAEGDDSVSDIITTEPPILEDKTLDVLYNLIKQFITYIGDFIKNSDQFCNNL